MPRALIIDDEPSVRFAITRWFERQGYTVSGADDGPDALAQLANLYDEEVDVILCDLHLPGISGAELLTRLAKHRPLLAARLILCTGDSVDFAPPDSVLARHPLVLQKPFDFASLQAIVDRVVKPS
jgi:CheY-like chemotaxis protein